MAGFVTGVPVGGAVIGEPVEGTVSCFFKYVAYVFAQNAKAHEVETSKNGNQDGHGGPAGHGLSSNDAVEDVENQQKSGKGGQKANVEGNAQRDGGIGNNAIHGKVNHFLHGEFGNPCMTGRRFKLDGCLSESKASYDTADEPAVLPELQERIQRFTVHQSEIGTSRDHPGGGNGINHRIVAGGGYLF